MNAMSKEIERKFVEKQTKIGQPIVDLFIRKHHQHHREYNKDVVYPDCITCIGSEKQQSLQCSQCINK